MYTVVLPTPIIYPLTGQSGYDLRVRANNYLQTYMTTTGAERGSTSEQGAGLLAEVVVRHILGLPDIEDDPTRDTELGYDILSPTGIKIDVKCRGGKLEFKEKYLGTGDIYREAKHNFFARQFHDDRLNTDIYLMTHLRYAGDGLLPGTKAQRNWCLYICGWVSKDKVIRDGVYIPRGGLTEQGNTWFCYRGQEIEFYHRNLNGLTQLSDILLIDKDDVEADLTRLGHYHLTGVDATRIAYDMVGRGLLRSELVDYVKQDAGITTTVYPMLQNNQYRHLAYWLEQKGQITEEELNRILEALPETPYTGI